MHCTNPYQEKNDLPTGHQSLRAVQLEWNKDAHYNPLFSLYIDEVSNNIDCNGKSMHCMNLYQEKRDLPMACQRL